MPTARARKRARKSPRVVSSPTEEAEVREVFEDAKEDKAHLSTPEELLSWAESAGDEPDLPD